MNNPIERRGGGAARRKPRSQAPPVMAPALVSNIPLYEALDETGVEMIHDDSMAILEEVGIDLRDDEALAMWRAAGAGFPRM